MSEYFPLSSSSAVYALYFHLSGVPSVEVVGVVTILASSLAFFHSRTCKEPVILVL